MFRSRLMLPIVWLGSLLATARADPVGSVSSDVSNLDFIRSQKNQLTVLASSTSSTPMWSSTLGANGTWPDIDYTSGCTARRANWPASIHWSRIESMASSYYSGLPDPSLQNSTTLLAEIQSAMNWWFNHDFTNLACIDQGGDTSSTCPCGTPGLWNTNWFDQMILIPKAVGETCLLLQPVLSANEVASCVKITSRAYARIDTNIYNVGPMTGANALDISSVGVSLGLLQSNATIIQEAFDHVNAVITVTPNTQDGIKPDGSFFQHDGMLYTGNYGKDFINDFLAFQIQSAGTQFAAGDKEQKAFATLMEGTEWMIFKDVKDEVLHWQYNVIGRMISFAIVDNQASANVAINISSIGAATELWNNSQTFAGIAARLQSNATTANVGHLNGNRFFWNADYMVHRRKNYVVSLKMLSNRTRNTECDNSQNIKGFHLSDGAIFTYLSGYEYTDIFAVWDWNLIPGITVDYGATPLECSEISFYGNQAFVGAASDGSIGVATQDFLNPLTRHLKWSKAFFFFDEAYVVLASNITASSNAPVYTVLDQRKWNGDVHVSGSTGILRNSTSHNGTAKWLHHDNIGYVFHTPKTTVSISLEQKFGEWIDIGISTSNDTQKVFTAYIAHDTKTPVVNDSIAYTVYPGMNFDSFGKVKDNGAIEIIDNSDTLMAVEHKTQNVVAAVFRAAVTVSHLPLFGENGHARHKQAKPYSVSVNKPIIAFTRREGHNLALSVTDPTQLLKKVVITVTGLNGTLRCPDGASAFSCHSQTIHGNTAGNQRVRITVTLPTGDQAGTTVSGNLLRK